MAEGVSESPNSVLPHGETKLLHKYTPYDYGPLAMLPDATTIISSFRGGSYYLTEVEKREGVRLYRLHDGSSAGALGQYWTTEKREGVLGDRIDLAVPLTWNDFTKVTSLVIPKGIFLYEGPIGPRPGGLVGGGWQIFIPREVLQPLYRAMEITQNFDSKESISMSERSVAVETYVEEARQIQKKFFERYESELNQMNRKIIDEFCNCSSTQSYLTAGNNLHNLDAETQRVLTSLSNATSTEDETASTFGTGKPTTHLLHSDKLRLADGAEKCICLYVKIDSSQTTFEWV